MSLRCQLAVVPQATSSVTRNKYISPLEEGRDEKDMVQNFQRHDAVAPENRGNKHECADKGALLLLTMFSLRDFVKNKKTVCLKNPSRITSLQSSPLQCKLRSAVHFFKVFSDDFSSKFKMQVHSFSADPSRASGSDPNPIVINPKLKDSCSRFLVRYGSGIEATLSEGPDTGSTPHPIELK